MRERLNFVPNAQLFTYLCDTKCVKVDEIFTKKLGDQDKGCYARDMPFFKFFFLECVVDCRSPENINTHIASHWARLSQKRRLVIF